MRRERVTEYWLVLDDCDDVRQLARGDGTYTVAGVEPPFEDCDFDGLFGLVVLEAERWERERNEAVQSDDEDADNWWPGDNSHEIFYQDTTFRMATAEEAAALGLIAPTVAVTR